VQGYVVGVPDSADFARRCEAEWFPLLRGLYPLPEAEDRSPDAAIIRQLHWGIPAPGGSLGPQYPAHLHIDLLPAAQGGGHGRRLMETLFGRLREGGAAGVHLGVGRSNVRAQGFYARLGFVVLEEDEGGLTLGLTL
ncbi:MAG: GNAT family N-acetyltransferase, partial [Deinococcus sp.]